MDAQVQNIITSAYGMLSSVRGLTVQGPANDALYPHSAVIPIATYSPWVNDQAFQTIYSAIQSHTLVDQYRLYELWQLCKELQYVEGDVLEVGVWRGGSAALLLHRLLSLQIDAKVFAADTFTGVVKVTDADPSYHGGEHNETSVETVQVLSDTVNNQPLEILEGIFPDDTGYLVTDKQFRLVHIDVDIYQSAKDILEWVWPKVSVGGAVVFDDYGFITCQGIAKLVEEYRGEKDRLVIHNLNGHALMIKLH